MPEITLIEDQVPQPTVYGPLARGELRAELVIVAGLAVAVAALFALTPASAVDPLLVLLSIGLLAVTQGARIEIPGGWTAPIQVVLVPVLFLLPGWLVPLSVAVAIALARVPDVVRGRASASRLLLSPGNAWFSVGPAAVLAAGGSPAADAAGPPLLVAMLAAQVGTDFCVSIVWERLTRGASPARLLADLWPVYAVDATLAPVGLLAALAIDDSPWYLLLCIPLFVILAVFARDRRARLAQLTELNGAYRGTALALADVVDADDAYTGMHTRDVVELSLAVAGHMGLDELQRRNVEFGALLHDIGKVAIPNEIVNKPGPLTDQEWKLMRMHTVTGQRMLDRVGGLMREVGAIVRASHERWDGGGYPDGLAGAEIALEARVICACDAYSAMTTTRSYRRAMPVAAAIAELVRCAGTQFDPAVVDALVRVIGEPAAEPDADLIAA